jgi:hypothetical protein
MAPTLPRRVACALAAALLATFMATTQVFAQNPRETPGPRNTPGADDDRGGTPPGVSRSGSAPMDGAVIDKTKPGTASDRARDPCENVPNDEKLACKAESRNRPASPPSTGHNGAVKR